MIDMQIETQQEMKPDRVYGGESYFSLTRAQEYFSSKYWSVSKTGFVELVKRLKIQKWEIPAGSRDKFLKQSDLDKAAAPVEARRVS